MIYNKHSKDAKFTSFFKNSILLCLFFIITFSSCTSRKKILYLQDIAQDSKEVYNNQIIKHRITSGDILYIGIESMNKELISMFKSESKSITQTQWNSAGNIYVKGYSVDNSGNIFIPVFGEINVSNMLLTEAQKSIENKIRSFVSDASISVKLLNFNYTLIGEVSRPGTYTNFSNKINIFQALGHGGDLTIYGNRNKIQLIREYPDGKRVHYLDITKSSILTSDYYYLQPNDIIYVEPLSNKSFRQNLPNISIIFSSISTLVLVLNFINKK